MENFLPLDRNGGRASIDQVEHKKKKKRYVTYTLTSFRFTFIKIDTGLPLCPGDKRDCHEAQSAKVGIHASGHRPLHVREILVEERLVSQLALPSKRDGKDFLFLLNLTFQLLIDPLVESF